MYCNINLKIKRVKEKGKENNEHTHKKILKEKVPREKRKIIQNNKNKKGKNFFCYFLSLPAMTCV